MTVLIKILSIAGVLLLAAVVLLLWLVMVPRRFRVEYSKRDGLILKMKVALFKVTLYPIPEFISKRMNGKPEKNITKQNTDTDKQEEKNVLKDINFSFDLIRQVLAAAGGTMKKVFAAIKFTDVSFTLPVYAGDPLKTQQAYGVVTNSFYGLSMLMQKYMQITFKSPVIIADFADTYGESVYFYTDVSASPVLLLAAAYFAYTQYKEITENNKKTASAVTRPTENVAEKESING